MPKLSPQDAREKHARNLKAAEPDIRRGVERLTVSPTVSAANNIEKMRQNLVAAFDDGRVERGLRATSLEDWKSAFLKKGINNIGPGIDAASAKMEDFFTRLFSYQATLQNQVHAMDDLTIQDSRARLLAWFDGMSGFSYK